MQRLGHALLDEKVLELIVPNREKKIGGKFRGFMRTKKNKRKIMSTNSAPLWTMYSGRPNTAELLREKASVVAELIAMSLDSGETLAPTYSTGFGERETLLAKAETSAYWLHIVDIYAFRLLSPSERDVLMSALEEGIVGRLREMGMDRSEFLNLIQTRYAEYPTYKKWVAKEGESAKGTLNWEFAKKIAVILGVGKNALFNVQLSILLLRHLNRMELPTLLKG